MHDYFMPIYLQTPAFVTSEYQILSIMWPANEGKKKSL